MSYDDDAFGENDCEMDNEGDWGSADDWNEEDGGLTDVPIETLPRVLRDRILRDVEELRLISPFHSSQINFGGGTRISLRIGFPAKALGLNTEQARAWTLSNDQYLCVEVSMPQFYWNSVNHSQVRVSVGLTPDDSMPTDQTPLTKCKLSWPLMNAIQTKLIPELPALIEPAFNLTQARHVQETCQCSLAQAVRAVTRHKDMSKAIESIANGEQLAEIEEIEAKEVTIISHTNNNQFGGRKDSWQEEILVEPTQAKFIDSELLDKELLDEIQDQTIDSEIEQGASEKQLLACRRRRNRRGIQCHGSL